MKEHSTSDTARSFPEHDFRSIIDQQVEWVVQILPDGIITFANESFSNFTGKSGVELVGTDFFDLFPGEFRKEFRRWFKEKESNRKGFIIISEPEQKKPNRRTIRWSFRPTLKGRDLLCYQVVGIDITEQKLVEKELRESINKFKMIFEYAPDAYFLADLKGKFLDGNRRAEELIGYKKEELIGKSFLKINLIPKSEIPKALKILANNALGKASGPNSFTLYTKTGESRIIELSNFPVELGGKTVVLGIARDVTARNKAEDVIRKWAQIFSKADWGIATDEPDSNTFSFVNPAFARMYGYAVEELEGANISKVFAPETLGDLKKGIEILEKNGKVTMESTHMKKDGTRFPVLINVILVSEERGDDYRVITVQNISETKLAEASLRDSEERLRLMTENIEDGISIVEDKRVIYMNDRMAEIYGRTKEVMMTLRGIDLCAPEEKDRLKKIYAEIDNEGKLPEQIEFWIVQENGNRRYIRNRYSEVKDRRSLRYIIATDITELETSRLQLIEREEKLLKILNNSPDAIILGDIQGNILDFNPAAARLFKISYDNKEKRRYQDFLPEKEWERLYNGLSNLVDKKIIEAVEFSFKNADGDLFPGEISVSLLFDTMGKPSGIVSIIKNIEERKKLELKEKEYLAEMEFLAQSAELLLKPITVEGIYTMIQDSMISLFGDTVISIISDISSDVSHFQVRDIRGLGKWKDSLKKITGFDVTSMNGKIDPKFSGIMKKGKLLAIDEDPSIISGGGLSRAAAASVTRIFGIRRLYSISLSRKNEIFGNLTLVAKQGFDTRKLPLVEAFIGQVSVALERKFAEDELVQAKEKAVESDKLKTAFLANMSHEIRTPMNAIVGFSQLLASKEFSDEEKKEFVDMIQAKSEDLLSILNEIIDISLIESGQINIQIKELQLIALLKEVFKSHSYDDKPDVEFRLNIPEDEGEIVLNSDPLRLKQVMNNLVGNAFKFTRQGVIEMGIKSVNPGFIEIYVSDTGIGIPLVEHEKVFERFYKHGDNTTDVTGGSGIGLSICKEIVTLLNGHIKLVSEVDKGSKFTIEMPRAAEKRKINEANRKTMNETKITLKDKTILIAEDEETNFSLLEHILKGTNAELIHAWNGREALEYYRSNGHIDLILMDMKMPIMSGFDATRQIREEGGKMPIIALTAFAMDDDRERCLNIGCSDFITKPLRSQVLLDSIQNLLEGYGN